MFKTTLNILVQGAFIGALLLCGCQPTPSGNSSGSDPVALVRSGANTSNNDKPSRPEVPETCQSRLQDRLCQAMLFHYAINQTFPQRLVDLIGYEGVRTQADIRCPISGKPYIYNPDSTIVLDTALYEVVKGGPDNKSDPRIVKQDLRYKVILYDAEPHDNMRFGIVRLIRVGDDGVEIPNFDNPSLYVVPIPEDQFRLKLNLP